MSEIERLAAVAAEEVQAIAKETFQDRSHLYIYPDADEMRRVVRAILQAMRELDEHSDREMFNAPDRAGVRAGDYSMASYEALPAWNAMIDHLLAE